LSPKGVGRCIDPWSPHFGRRLLHLVHFGRLQLRYI
jgi:hypothetical protein